MRKAMRFEISNIKVFILLSILLLNGCAPKVTACIYETVNLRSKCEAPNPKNNYYRPVAQMIKYGCLSPDDFADLMRGEDGNITLCTIVDIIGIGLVKCNAANGDTYTNLAAMNKYTCLSPDDLANYERWKQAGKP